MPPEPLPWDRKDFFKERKHERVEPPGRWRDSSVYHNGASREFNRFGSADFRRPPGHAKQGDWHLYCEDSCNGYAASRYNEKMLENESIRSYNLRLEGKYGRNGCREGRGCYSYRDGHAWEVKNGSPDKSTKPHDVNSEKRSADDILTYATKSHSDYQATCDQVRLKEQADSKATSFGAMGPVQKCNNETSVGSVDWKHRKWSRSGSMSSRGSGFSHSSSSKSLGIDSLEDKAELQPKVAVQSRLMDSAACVTSVVPVDEMVSRKKQRLGWGEGLAKYEKKKVEVPDTSMNGAGATVSFSNAEPNRSISSDLVEKSPIILVFSDCASPATPSSVACSSSPGLEEKSFMKAVSVDNDVSNFFVSPGIGSQSHLESLPFNLEKLDASSFANLGSSLSDLLQSDNPCLSDSGFVRSTALNKLLMWKSDALKALEMTESEIDLLENQLKSLKSESQMRISSAAEIDSLPLEQNLRPCMEKGPKLVPISEFAHLEMYPCVDVDQDKTPVCNVDLEVNIAVKEEEIDSPGTATSKFMELAPPFKATSLSERNKELCCYEDMTPLKSTCLELTSVAFYRGTGFAATSGHGDDINIANLNSESLTYMDNVVGIEKGFHSTLVENKELSSRASEVLHKLLPIGFCSTGTSVDSFLSPLHNDLQVRENIVRHRLSSKFKERVLALKYKVFHYQWKEDLRLLSERKYRAKYQKKCEVSLRVMTNGQQKHRSSNRSRFAYPGNLNLVPTKDVISFARKMLSEPQVKLRRNSLRMPSLILDERERLASRFITNNGLIEDPLAVEKERCMINPWTSEEKGIFMNKLAMFGKDFRKIASFLEHKTTADCVEFYYKNHKSDCFEKIKKPDLSKRKSANSTYLVTAGAKWNRDEMNSASLDILGAASVIAANAETSISNRKLSGRIFSGGRSDTKGVQIDDEITEMSSSIDFAGCDRETVAADVLAGICGSMSSEAMSSCITCSVDAGDGYHDWMCQKVDSVLTRPSTSDVTHNVDEDTCSDESCGELDSTDWTDDEKSVFIQAVSSYGKDFTKISRTVGTRTRDQCRVFFSKGRKCLGLDSLQSRAVRRNPLSDGTNGGGSSDTEDACVLESSVVGSEKSGLKEHEDPPIVDVNQCESDATTNVNLEIDLNTTEDNKKVGGLDDAFCDAFETKDSSLIQLDDVADPTSKPDDSLLLNVNHCSSSLERQNNTETTVGQIEEILTDEKVHAVVPVSVCEEVKPCYPSSDASVMCKSAEGFSTVHGGIDLEIQEPLSLKSSGDEWEKKCLAGISNGNSVLQYPDSVICKNFCRLTNAASSANLHQVPIELNIGIKNLGISLPKENAFASKMSLVHLSDVKDESPGLSLHEENAFAAEMSIAYCTDVKDESSSRDGFSHLRQPRSSTPLQSPPSVCQMNVQTEKELSGDISSRLIPDAQRIPKSSSVVSSLCAPQECFLKKCNGPKTCSSMAELPLLSQSSPQTGDQRKARSRSLSDTEKPCRHGNVKLFGQILNSGSHEAEDKANQKPTISKSAGLLGMDGCSSVLNFSRDSHSKMDNVPIRSYGFWDGNRIQTGLSSLPDSSMLMAKYPAAFGNFSTSSSRKEQQLPVAVRSNDQNFNGVSTFSSRDLNTSNGFMDHQVYRSCDPVDTNQQSDMLSEMQRHNFEAMAGFQQQGKGIVGVNVLGGRGGILVSGPCTSVLDPVVAMRLHFAKTEQYGSQKGSVIREDESSWICKGGGIGR